MKVVFFVVFVAVLSTCCSSQPDRFPVNGPPVRPGAGRLDAYLPKLKGRTVGLVVNHSSRVGGQHLIDTLRTAGVEVVRLFSPEHGLRGTAADGEIVQSGRDPVSGLPVVSLYGQFKKPRPADLRGLEMLVFDIQDVGARFYTYLSTLHYILEAAAEQNLPVLVLDRPNPNAHLVDGPVLDTAYRSFVGMHPVPVVYGLTIGEYARMINGEGWLHGGIRCRLEVIPCANYHHRAPYALPVRPSPNLPNMRAIYLYPSLCFFEGTVVSVGRGTDYPFQWYGHPRFMGPVLFTPQPNAGSRYPPLEGKGCRGRDLRSLTTDSLLRWDRLRLEFLWEAVQEFPEKDSFFLPSGFFDKLAGGPSLRQQLLSGWDVKAIRESWQADLEAFRAIRRKYLLYED